jgi:hypothetical protein
MESIWYKNPKILIDNFTEIIPKKEFNNLEKINSIVRLSFYYSILVFILKLDKKWYLISIILLVYSFKLNKKIDNNKLKNKKDSIDTFTNSNVSSEYSEEKSNIEEYENYVEIKDNIKENKDCKRPTINNPFMNDLVYSENDKDACNYSKKINEEITKKFYENDSVVEDKIKDNEFVQTSSVTKLDLSVPISDPIDKYKLKFQIKYDEGILKDKGINPTDPFNKKVNERQFFSMPVTKSHNNLVDFAEWVYGDSGLCKSSKFIDPLLFNKNKTYKNTESDDNNGEMDDDTDDENDDENDDETDDENDDETDDENDDKYKDSNEINYDTSDENDICISNFDSSRRIRHNKNY